MNKLKFVFIFFSLLIINEAFAQYSLSGQVVSALDSSYAGNCIVRLSEGKKETMTDSLGHFEFTNLKNGKYTVSTSSPEFKPYQQTISINGENQFIQLLLLPDYMLMDDVIMDIPDQTHMKGVQDMGIYEGKKSEVIIPDNLVANTATNNARQIYSRVAGLNIWENDGAGLQLSIGGRGLDPNRSSNFNVRQNGYDISADALGYPESYYTPSIEAIERIEVVRGAASLQYGTQFGGLINFVLRKPVEDKKIQLVSRQTLGSFGFFNSFNSISGTIKKFSYYTFFQYKKGNGWRPNSQFDNYNIYSNLKYKLTEKTDVGLDITITDYLAQQPGGLTDKMFDKDPRQSNRERNWFKVKWNMAAIHFDHKFNESNQFNLRVFGLSAYRYSVGFRPYRVENVDDNSERDLIKGEFSNWGAEARFLKRYSFLKKDMVLLVGTRYYHGFNHTTQGYGSKGKDADFNYVPDNLMKYDYRFPNRNVSVFAENIIYLNEKISVTPGVRYEHIHTKADGFYGNELRDLAGNLITYTTYDESRANKRQFILGGIGLSYKPATHFNLYANISQNYRSITFSDMRIVNPSSDIDLNLQDEKGYSADLGIRSLLTTKVGYDVSVFYLNYNNRIGDYPTARNGIAIRRRGNIGQAVIMGVESYVESDLLKLFFPKSENWRTVGYANTAFIYSEYTKSEIVNVKGNQVEFVPTVNFKTGIRVEYKKLKASFQYTYLADQYSDATNETEGGIGAVVGVIPAYAIMDLSLSYEFKKFKVEGSINNLGNAMYFTRRATGYPGPGIIPSDGRSFYITLQVKI
jgi:Fe(3+) dicitrate transport protein